MSVALIREAAEILRDPAGRNPEDVQRIALDLLDLADCDLIIGLSADEARAIASSANTMGAAYRGILADAGREEPRHPAPLRTAAMKIETAMIAEQII